MNQLGCKLAGALALLLAALSSPVIAAETAGSGRNFNHMTTGFPLSGVHAVAPCETCHIGGVFKGTPKDCDGCHALGKRVVATPKSNNHIVTNAPCETCHFNTSTWLGARYNHGSARPGNCQSCHNSRMAAGKPGSHNVGVKATESCDKCHRTMAWLPASWNHTDVASDCSVCHNAAGPGRNLTVGSHLPLVMAGLNFTNNCKACHTNYFNFYSAYFNHVGATTNCGSCHNNATYGPGVKQMTSTAKHGIYSAVGITNCQSCHTTYSMGSFPLGRYDHMGATNCQNCHTAAYSPTIRAMSSKHIPIPTTTTCNICHTSAAAWSVVARGSTLHNVVAGTPCYTCHGSNTLYPGNGQQTESWPNFHKSDRNPGATDCSSNGCHLPGGVGPTGKSAKGVLYQVWD